MIFLTRARENRPSRAILASTSTDIISAIRRSRSDQPAQQEIRACYPQLECGIEFKQANYHRGFGGVTLNSTTLLLS